MPAVPRTRKRRSGRKKKTAKYHTIQQQCYLTTKSGPLIDFDNNTIIMGSKKWKSIPKDGRKTISDISPQELHDADMLNVVWKLMSDGNMGWCLKVINSGETKPTLIDGFIRKDWWERIIMVEDLVSVV